MTGQTEAPADLSTYRNRKTGRRYTVLMLGTHTETGGDVVVYSDGKRVWVRPLPLFLLKFTRDNSA